MGATNLIALVRTNEKHMEKAPIAIPYSFAIEVSYKFLLSIPELGTSPLTPLDCLSKDFYM